jgi:ribonuclease BN (tRNA processing enzyme)
MVDAVVISHQHPDHCSDLLTAFHAWTYRPEPRRKVPVYAPQQVWEKLSGFVDSGTSDAFAETFDFHPVWTDDAIEIGAMSVSFVEMDHSVPTVGSRWEANGRSLFFTGDTGPAGDWSRLASAVDLMLSEASYQDATKNPEYPHHLTASDAGRIAREAGAYRLVLTHVPPYLDLARSVHEAEQTFDRPVAAAVPGATLDV